MYVNRSYYSYRRIMAARGGTQTILKYQNRFTRLGGVELPFALAWISRFAMGFSQCQ